VRVTKMFPGSGVLRVFQWGSGLSGDIPAVHDEDCFPDLRFPRAFKCGFCASGLSGDIPVVRDEDRFPDLRVTRALPRPPAPGSGFVPGRSASIINGPVSDRICLPGLRIAVMAGGQPDGEWFDGGAHVVSQPLRGRVFVETPMPT